VTETSRLGVNAKDAENVQRPLLSIRDLVVTFRSGRRGPLLRAVDGAELDVLPGETVGLVGESGSGKSTLGKAILGLAPVKSGTIQFNGREIAHLSRRERRNLASEIQVVFQDPYSSLNPAKRIGETLLEPLRVHEELSRPHAESRVHEMLELVGLPTSAAKRYPRQFSGGQRQRIAIARALMVYPRLVICDEPVSALDLSIQAQILNLFRDIQCRLGLSYLFVAHDLGVVHYMCDRIYVLYRGQIMEKGPADVVYRSPAHPYTRRLLESSPLPDPTAQRSRQRDDPRLELVGRTAHEGCPFAARCDYAIEICRRERPQMVDGKAACHRAEELSPGDGVETAKA
jgi:oligopeptide/dipeptide ABC transporter ATP-binding protein